MTMPYADLNDQQIFYEDSGGNGLPVILGHGFLMDRTMFDPQVRVLAPEFRVIRFDERGFGRTKWDGKPFTYWDLADDCIKLLDHLGIERAVVGGMSQGGFLSMRAALGYPERVRGLVLISTAANVDDEQTHAGNRQLLDAWETLGPQDPLLGRVAELILGGREHWEPWVSRWRGMGREALVLPGKCMLERDDISMRLRDIECPAIVFHGSADMALTIDRGEAISRALPGCKGFVRVEGATHASNLTHPDVVNPPLLAFLREYAARSE